MVQPGGGQPDMQQIMQQAQKMQQQLMTAQAQLAEAEVTGQAGNGMVSVTLTGAGQVKDVKIDPKVVDPEDVDTLQDLVFGAIDDAQQAAQELTQETMGPLSGMGGAGGPGGGLSLPGM
ncbi:MAG: YbaB/EbfC family nucleoid-associated protein [Pseudonocardiaceae bacterium]|nr:YbaB/EbfC family nucleoid-associated protein [Pseudonocardiaceae bacterium]